jgi:YD repeat-containing protein
VADQLATQTDPDGEVLTSTYGANGLLAQLTSTCDAAGQATGPGSLTVASGVQYTPLDRVAQATLGGTATPQATLAQAFCGLGDGGP